MFFTFESFAMSRFWAADNSSSSESSDDSYASSSEEEVGRATGQNKWEELSEDSSEEDVGREVKSAKDKVFEGLKKHISSIRSGLRGEDWNRIQDGKWMLEAIKVLPSMYSKHCPLLLKSSTILPS